MAEIIGKLLPEDILKDGATSMGVRLFYHKLGPSKGDFFGDYSQERARFLGYRG